MHKLVLTRIEKDYNCDIIFPKIDWNKFERNNDFDSTKQEENGIIWYVTSYTKQKN